METCGKLSVGLSIRVMRFVRVGLGVGGMRTASSRVSGRRSWRRSLTRWRVDGFGGFVPLRLLGVDVDIEPADIKVKKRGTELDEEGVPFIVLIIPLGFPSLRHLIHGQLQRPGGFWSK